LASGELSTVPTELCRKRLGFTVQIGAKSVGTDRHSVRQLHTKEVILMNKFGLATLIAGGLIGVVVGLAAPGEAATTNQLRAGPISSTAIPTDLSDLAWINQIQPRVHVPHVSTQVHQSR
jgi:hypothetical protein